MRDDGTVRVLDFGLAKALERDGRPRRLDVVGPQRLASVVKWATMRAVRRLIKRSRSTA